MIVLLIACQIETTLSEEVVDNDAAGTIAVSPSTLSLSAPLGESDTESVWIENIGNATLTLSAAEIIDSSRFSVVSPAWSSRVPCW